MGQIKAGIGKCRKNDKMEIDIKCLNCGKGTRHFELGSIYYMLEKPSETLAVKNLIICPKCRKDISNEKCVVKANELLMRLVTANICLSVGEMPKHLQGAYPLRKRDYDLVKDNCQARLKMVDRF